METIFMTLTVPFLISLVIFTFIKRDIKKRIHRAYRKFQGESQDGFMGEYMNLFFPIPYKSSNPDFYKIDANAKLAQRFKTMRLIQVISLGMIIIIIILQINFGF